MNNPLRRFSQRFIEFPVFQKLGLQQMKCDILELGCGSGYGAALLARLRPFTYLGIDLMEEQVELARCRNLPGAVFMQGDASHLVGVADGSKDLVVIFGILHHMPGWRDAIRECARVLVPGGSLFLEEPGKGFIRRWDRLFKWGHAADAGFDLAELEAELARNGFLIEKKLRALGFGSYHALKKEGL
mgnify:CR=1 FL=1